MGLIDIVKMNQFSAKLVPFNEKAPDYFQSRAYLSFRFWRPWSDSNARPAA
jgi:hypothetical protein